MGRGELLRRIGLKHDPGVSDDAEEGQEVGCDVRTLTSVLITEGGA